MNKSNVVPIQSSKPTKAQIASQLPTAIHIVQTDAELEEISTLWQQTYRTIYPNFKISRQDPYNERAYILYTRNADNVVNGSARLVVDNPLGLPEDGYFPTEVNMYRQHGYKLMEFGRFIISGGNISILKAYYNAVYQVAMIENIDIIPMAMKQKDVAFHCNLLGATLLSPDIKIPHGGKDKMSCVSWELSKTKERFFPWAGLSYTLKEAV